MKRKSNGKIEISDFLTEEYMRKNRFKLTYLILNQSLATCYGRYAILRDKAQQIRNYILSYQSSQENISYDIVRLQIIYLDLISNLFIFMEDYLGHSNHLRISLRNFPSGIASPNWGVVEKEIKNLHQLRKSDITKYLNLPDISDFESNDRKLVRNNYRAISDATFRRVKRILLFYKRYYRVYIKYKHILPAILGVHSKNYNTQNNGFTVTSNIYVRDYFIKKSRKYYKTYIILASGLESLEYYESLIDDIRMVFEVLLISRISYLSNQGKPFVIAANDYVTEKDLSDWGKIIKKVNKFPAIIPETKTIVNFVSPLKNILDKKLLKDTIYKMNRDIFAGTK